MIAFSFPLIFLLLPIIVLIWYFFGREKIGMVAPNALIAKYLRTPKSVWMLWILRMIMITILLSIVGGASITTNITKTTRIPQDIMVVFDISLSMLAEDIAPNRISVAKNVVRNFISMRSGDSIGLIIFAGKPFVSIPFSTDYRGIMNIVEGLSPNLIRQDLPGLSGTNIGDALLLANMTYSGSEAPVKSIILLTDGRANIGIDPYLSAAESSEKNIQIYPIGIGSRSGGELSYTDNYGQKTYFYDGNGGILKSDLDEPMLRKIADTTKGKYFHADDRVGLSTAFTDIAEKLPNQTKQKTEIQHLDLTPALIVIFVILLLIERAYLGYVMRKYRLV